MRAEPQQRLHDFGAVFRTDHLFRRDRGPGRHGRVDEAGAQRSRANAVLFLTSVEGAREVDHCRLGRAVDGQVRGRARPRDRREVHDQAVALAQHRQCRGSHQERSAQVDVQLQVDVLRRELVDGTGDPHAGGVHEHVEPAVLGAMLLDQATAVICVRNVGRDGMGAERLGRRLDLLGGPGGEREGEAVLAQHARNGKADT